MYSKLEKTPDSVIKDYFELLTDLNLDKLPENPRERQKILALEVVAQFHGKEAAIAAQSTAAAIVTQGRTITGNSSQTLGTVTGSATGTISSNTINKDSVPEYSLSQVEFPAKLFYILSASQLCASSGEGRRQIAGGAVRLEGDRITEANLSFDSPEELTGKVLQVGKKKFIRLVL
jgi:tyrosyl-tRNA synthetase